MRGHPVIEALGPIAPGEPVTIRVSIRSEDGGPHPRDGDDPGWEELDVGLTLASAYCDFPVSDQGKGTIRGRLRIRRSGGCDPFEASAVLREAPPDGIVWMLAAFDHRGRHAGTAERSFRVSLPPEADASGP